MQEAIEHLALVSDYNLSSIPFTWCQIIAYYHGTLLCRNHHLEVIVEKYLMHFNNPSISLGIICFYQNDVTHVKITNKLRLPWIISQINYIFFVGFVQNLHRKDDEVIIVHCVHHIAHYTMGCKYHYYDDVIVIHGERHHSYRLLHGISHIGPSIIPWWSPFSCWLWTLCCPSAW